ncbi:DUF3304 domain-containing protein [Photorhabdus laumondii subsp. laumondii]|uniref:Photorhabdus luminescens subsp. laumondii TTO1 complete genome segment 12/17 n=2 Tax=Photorhabdus laumondii subsp. laumondii TaxID=141679 RepID=Q7MB12_PHOLL|nr:MULTISPECIES: DUF3304 domain-containing protein [Photorhabdus]AWK42935.1 hypothetical protein A4R40_16200 [Photorhabdus laumondii subsp. laumondii]AXG48254.1 DUF3304 domain-containing protein [Photorhabdus laumondii subsp. laumondii]MCC8386270.1 DUF3304 domain-containing protein [Photorhabdus laumondii]MCC8415273.1 DUF3304 domain-containing protein [Photorhabdus laumondii]NDK97274.1 DUF3304 domain-containing protein [Photorhabdus laumondii subsp. laumondii]
MKKQQLRLAVLCLLLVACSQFSAQAGIIEAINHTKWAINRFSVDGEPGIDIIGPYQGGGGGCCYRAPEKWRPGMTVKVDWETGEASTKGFPGFADEEKYLSWRNKLRANDRQHSKVVPVPDYTGQRTCGITVHFLPCDQVKITTSCNTYGSPNYPIKEPLEMKEPKVCPK